MTADISALAGRPADAVPPTEEAITLYRDQAAANPAYLPDLASALRFGKAPACRQLRQR